MKSAIIISNIELRKILSCNNATEILLFKGEKIFIDTIKAYDCPLISNDYELTRSIRNESSLFHPHLVELVKGEL